MGHNSEARNEIEKLTSNVANSGEQLASQVKEGLDELSQAVKKTGSAAISDASKVATKAYKQVVSSGTEGVHQIEQEIQRYPLAAVLTALGVGALFGLMVRRS